MKRLVFTASFLAILMPAPARAIMEWELSLQRLLSGLKIGGKQDAASTEQQVVARTKVGEAKASTLIAADNAMRVARAKHTYGFETGSGYSACDVNLGLADQRDANASSRKVTDALANADRTWLSEGGDGAKRIQASLDLRRRFYCTDAEEKRTGWCAGGKQGGYGAGDSDAGPWLFNRNFGAEEVMTAADYLDVVAPLPGSVGSAQNMETDSAKVIFHREGAIMSGARAALSAVIVGGMGGDRREGGNP